MVENVRMTSGTAPGSTGGPPACPDAELDALHAAALALSGELDPEAVLELIVDHAAGLVAGSFGYLYMVDESEQLLVERIAHGALRAVRRHDDRARRRRRRTRLAYRQTPHREPLP